MISNRDQSTADPQPSNTRAVTLWILWTIAKEHSFRLALTLSAALAGLGIVALGLWTLFRLANVAKEDAILDFKLITINPALQPDQAFVAAGISGTLLIGFFLIYMGQSLAARLAGEFFCRVSTQLDRLLVEKGLENRLDLTEPAHAYARLRVGDARDLAFIVWRIPSILMGIVVASLSLTAMIYLNALVTIIVMAGVAVTIPPLLAANRAAIESTRLIREQGSLLNLNMRARGQALISIPRAEQGLVQAEKFPSSEDLTITGNAIYRRYQALSRSELYANLLLGVVAGAVLWLLIRSALSGQLSWVALGAYLVALQIFSSGLRRITTGINVAARNFSSARRIHCVLTSATPRTLPQSQPDETSTLVLDLPLAFTDIEPAAKHQIALTPGSTIPVITGFRLNSASSSYFREQLAQHGCRSVYVAPHDPLRLPLSLRESLGLAPQFDLNEILRELPSPRSREAVKAFYSDADSPPIDGRVPSRKVRINILYGSFFLTDAKVFAYPASDMKLLAKKTQRHWYEKLSERVAMPCYQPSQLDSLLEREDFRGAVLVSANGATAFATADSCKVDLINDWLDGGTNYAIDESESPDESG